MAQPAKPLRHAWDVTAAEAVAIQQRLRTQIQLTPLQQPVRLIAGVDTGFTDEGRTARAAIALYPFTALEPLSSATALDPARRPYLPALLSIRETPAVLRAAANLRHPPY